MLPYLSDRLVCFILTVEQSAALRRLKKVVNFFEEKCTPRENPGCAYAPLGAQLLWPQCKILATPLTQGDLA